MLALCSSRLGKILFVVRSGFVFRLCQIYCIRTKELSRSPEALFLLETLHGNVRNTSVSQNPVRAGYGGVCWGTLGYARVCWDMLAAAHTISVPTRAQPAGSGMAGYASSATHDLCACQTVVTHTQVGYAVVPRKQTQPRFATGSLYFHTPLVRFPDCFAPTTKSRLIEQEKYCSSRLQCEVPPMRLQNQISKLGLH